MVPTNKTSKVSQRNQEAPKAKSTPSPNTTKKSKSQNPKKSTTTKTTSSTKKTTSKKKTIPTKKSSSKKRTTSTKKAASKKKAKTKKTTSKPRVSSTKKVVKTTSTKSKKATQPSSQAIKSRGKVLIQADSHLSEQEIHQLSEQEPLLEQQVLDFKSKSSSPDYAESEYTTNPFPSISLTHIDDEQMLLVMNSDTYFAAREALYKNTFGKTDGVPWPTAQLGEDGEFGLAQLRPVQTDASPMLTPEEHKRWTALMWKHREELSDLDADILDSLSALWLLQASKPESDAVADVDDLLRMRNLQPKLGGKGGRGGFRPQQRQAVNNSLSHIQSVWLNVVSAPFKDGEKGPKLTIQSRAFVITDRMGQLHLDGGIDIRKFIFRPGKVFAHFLYGPGRPTAFLSARALQYDTYRQTWEKRLARFLSWQWGSQREQEWYGQTYTVQQLLDAVGEADSSIRPGKLRERLEKALDTIHEDGLIASWQYDYQGKPLPKRKWKDQWLTTTVLVEPPVQLVEHYEFLEERAKKAAELPSQTSQPFAERLKLQRKKQGWTQKQAAEYLDISQAHFSRLERGKMMEDALSAGLRKRIEDWLNLE